MQTTYHCLPCFLKQTLSVLEMVAADDATSERTLRQVMQQLSEINFDQTPPQMARTIHQQIRQLTGVPDPYYDEKQRFQQLAIHLYPQLEHNLYQSDNPLKTAIQLAIAGNSIDHGVYHDMDENRALKAIEQAMDTPILGDIDAFTIAIEQAESILYLGDNTGEIVLDKLLLKQLPLDKTVFAVRGGPILNDALMEDAEQAGITELVPVISNGDNSPGTLLKYCSESFRQQFDNADLIIAKGQGNYETLSDVDANIFFLLKAKCPVVAEHIGCQVNDALLYHR
ncbi:MAG: DUF89 family protein [Desulfuromonas sp.]|nr:DUF89 family protein [Desulfuromonas sp.]